MNIQSQLNEAAKNYQNDILLKTKLNYLQNPVFRKHPSKIRLKPKYFSQKKFNHFFPLKSYNSQNHQKKHAENIFHIKQRKNISIQKKNQKYIQDICQKVSKIQFDIQRKKLTLNSLNPEKQSQGFKNISQLKNNIKDIKSPSLNLITKSVPQFRSVIKPKISKYKLQAENIQIQNEQMMRNKSFETIQKQNQKYGAVTYQGFHTQRRHQDSQSLLRKNSLFLLNFIKTKYKNDNRKQLIREGFTGFVQNKQLQKFQQKLSHRQNIKFSRRQQYTQRVRKTIQEQRKMNVYHQTMGKKKSFYQLNHIFPEPW